MQSEKSHQNVCVGAELLDSGTEENCGTQNHEVERDNGVVRLLGAAGRVEGGVTSDVVVKTQDGG